MANLEAIQTAIVQKLLNTAAITAIVSTRIYDGYNQGTATGFPRICVSYVASSERPVNGVHHHSFLLSFFDDDRGVMAVIELAGLVRAALHNTQLTMTGWKCHWIRETGARMVGIEPGEVAHFAADYLVTVSAVS